MRKLLTALFLLTASSVLAQPLPPPAGGAAGAFGGSRHLYANGTSVGNGADTSIDTLMTFSLATGQLASVGDAIVMTAGGTLGATTDSRLIRMQFGGSVIASATATVAASTGWYCSAVITKTASNAQSYISSCVLTSSNANIRTGTLAVTDTAPIVVLVNGQNTTNPVAGSITSQIITVDYWH